MTNQEILSFQGHEFTYIFESNQTMPAYVKKIDLDKNIMSCWSFSLETDQGYKIKPLNKEEELEGACCVIYAPNINKIIRYLTEIKTTGKVLIPVNFPGGFNGCQL